MDLQKRTSQALGVEAHGPAAKRRLTDDFRPAANYDGYKYKTEWCKFFSEGKCSRGDACTYAHFEHDLAPASAPVSVAPTLIWRATPIGARVGKGVEATPTYAAPYAGGGSTQVADQKYKTEWCRFFPLGQCAKGDACTYRHSADEPGNSGASKGGAMGKGLRKGGPAMMAIGYGGPPARGGFLAKGASPSKGSSPAKGGFKAGPKGGAGWLALPARPTQAIGARAIVVGKGASGVVGSAAVPHNYKTVMCKFYQLGLCERGDQCTFIHDEDTAANGGVASLRLPRPIGRVPLPKPEPQVLDEIAGVCTRGDQGAWFHESQDAPFAAVSPAPMDRAPLPRELRDAPRELTRYKTEPCKFFAVGKCTRGENCTYAHNDDELIRSQTLQRQGVAPGAVQEEELEPEEDDVNPGRCVPPNRYKVQLCSFFEEGRCQRGDACTYAHGEEELELYQSLQPR